MTSAQVTKARTDHALAGDLAAIYDVEHSFHSGIDGLGIVWDDTNEIFYHIRANINPYTQAAYPIEVNTCQYSGINYIQGVYSMASFETTANTLFASLVSADELGDIIDFAKSIKNVGIQSDKHTPYYSTPDPVLTASKAPSNKIRTDYTISSFAEFILAVADSNACFADGDTSTVKFNIVGNIDLSSATSEDMYTINFPVRILGNKRSIYGHQLIFNNSAVLYELNFSAAEDALSFVSSSTTTIISIKSCTFTAADTSTYAIITSGAINIFVENCKFVGNFTTADIVSDENVYIQATSNTITGYSTFIYTPAVLAKDAILTIQGNTFASSVADAIIANLEWISGTIKIFFKSDVVSSDSTKDFRIISSTSYDINSTASVIKSSTGVRRTLTVDTTAPVEG